MNKKIKNKKILIKNTYVRPFHFYIWTIYSNSAGNGGRSNYGGLSNGSTPANGADMSWWSEFFKKSGEVIVQISTISLLAGVFVFAIGGITGYWVATNNSQQQNPEANHLPPEQQALNVNNPNELPPSYSARVSNTPVTREELRALAEETKREEQDMPPAYSENQNVLDDID